MKTEEYLGQIEKIDRTIKRKLETIQEFKTMAYNISASYCTTSQKTISKDKLGCTVSKFIDLETEANKLIDNFINTKEKIIKQINGISDKKMNDVLYYFYVKQLTINKIALNTGYSRKQIARIKAKAVNEFERLYGGEYLDIKKEQ